MGKYNKALILFGIILIALILEGLGIETGLDVEHYIGLLVADVLVWAVPNKNGKTKNRSDISHRVNQ